MKDLSAAYDEYARLLTDPAVTDRRAALDEFRSRFTSVEFDRIRSSFFEPRRTINS